jgi:hypothetical protein
MPELLDESGPQLNRVIRRGKTSSVTSQGIYDAGGTAITTISAIRMTFRAGKSADLVPGAVTLALTTSANGNGSSITTTGSNFTWAVTPADSLLFTAGTDYWYEIEIDLSAGSTWTALYGDLEVRPEGVT